MKIITLRIEESQYNELKKICKYYNIKSVSSQIRRGIEMLITSEKLIRKEANPYEYNKYTESERFNNFQENSGIY